MATNYVRFSSFPHLAEALCVCWDGDFPDQLEEAAPGTFAIPAKGLDRRSGGLDGFRRLAQQHGWKYELSAAPRNAPKVPMRSLVSGFWTYRDPLHLPGAATRHARVHYDPSANVEYLLGASTRAEAETLLRTMTAYLVEGIQLIPVLLNGAAPFRFFWALGAKGRDGQAPPPIPVSVLRKAPRVWWGPVGTTDSASIYLQWPYSVDLPICFLERIPWNAGKKGLVLLSDPKQDHASSVLVVHAENDPAQSVERFADLRLTAPPRDAVAAAHAPTPRFEVQLRLAPAEPRDALRDRIVTLRSEIEARRTMLKAMEDELDERISTYVEPLFLYYTNEPSLVPAPLRRLLIEWTDHPNDLGGIYYRRIDARSLPDGFSHAPATVHVVTTARALGLRNGQSDVTVGARLLDYPPQGDGVIASRFEQFSGWAPFGLRIFAPANSTLRLYPRLPECDVAAKQLSKVLLGEELDPERRSHSVVLLVPGAARQLQTCRLDAREFRPIVDAIRWQCAVQVAAADPHDIIQQQERATNAFVTGVVNALEQAAVTLSEGMIAEKYADLQKQLDACSARLGVMQTRNNEVEKVLLTAERDPETRLNAPLQALQAAINELLRRLIANEPLTHINTQIAAFEQARRELQQVIAQIARLRGEP